MKKPFVFAFFCLMLLVVFATPSTSNAAAITLTLVNAGTNGDLYELDDSDTINLSSNRNLNIRAEATLSSVSKVVFKWNCSTYRTETKAPYAFAGDSSGNYNSWTPATGTHKLCVQFYNANGFWKQRTISLTVTGGGSTSLFRKGRGDLISLHYDHCSDPDDGHSAAADRTMSDELGLGDYVHVVSGTYGSGMGSGFQEASDNVMNAAWGDDWLDAHGSYSDSVENTASRFYNRIQNGAHVWVKEGGPSDFTAAVVRRLRSNEYPYRLSQTKTRNRIHVVQHGPTDGTVGFNERNTIAANLTYVKNNTDYIYIGNGNESGNGTARLVISNTPSLKEDFIEDALAHSTSGSVWRAAFNYWHPISGGTVKNWGHKVDFSDTVELLHIMEIGTNTISKASEFASHFF